jgi:hypothetical protein
MMTPFRRVRGSTSQSKQLESHYFGAFLGLLLALKLNVNPNP